MANLFPADGIAGVGTGAPTMGLLQIQLSADQATNTRSGLALSVVGDANAAALYARPALGGPGGYNWYLTRNLNDGQGMELAPSGDVTFGHSATVIGEFNAFGPSLINNLTIAATLDVGGDTVLGANAEVVSDLKVGGALKIKTWELSVPDHVFAPDYRLAGLDEVADYVQHHRHLPELPSAAEVAADGLDAAAMILLLLKKVEELTLHLCRHERELRALQGAAPAASTASA